ncbi:MAG: HAD family hydrolase [Prevotella sp.]|nr:HAD family hydrolase [Prevotella sp.]
MNTRLIVFDFDGTLGDTQQIIVTTLHMTIAEMHLPERTDAECISIIGLPLAGCFRALYPDVNEETVTLCADTYRRLFKENMQTFTPVAFPHVVETLHKLKEMGLALTIASSRWHKSLVELVHNLGIDDCISYLLGADDVELAKPHPEPVLQTLAATGIDASHTLVVGDMAVDILMGARAGARTCGVTWGNGSRRDLEEAGADHIIDSIEELLPLL